MTTLTVAEPTNMLTYDLFGIQDSSVTSFSPTKVVAFDAGDTETFTFTGALSNFGSDHFPTAGTITGFTLQDSTGLDLTLSNFSLGPGLSGLSGRQRHQRRKHHPAGGRRQPCCRPGW